MTSGVIFLCLALVSFAGMGVLHKIGDRFHCQPLVVAAITMTTGLVAALVSSLGSEGARDSSFPWTVFGLAVPFGLFAAAAVWTFQAGVKHGPISTSWLLLNLSVAIPTSLSIVLYHEPVTTRKGVALGMIVVAIVLMWWDQVSSEPNRKTQGDV